MLFEQKINNSISEKVYFNKITNLNFENELLENKINLLNNESINNKDESKRIDNFINRINENTISYTDEDVSVFSKFIDKIEVVKKIEKHKLLK